MRKWYVVLAVICLGLLVGAPAQANPIADPLPADLYIQHNGLDWAWAAPISVTNFYDNVLYAPEFHEGWRYATEEEWANRPAASQFKREDGSYRSAAPYWNSYFTHIDEWDGEAGYVNRLANVGNDLYEIWYVRGEAVPVPSAGLAGLIGLGLVAGYRKLRSA